MELSIEDFKEVSNKYLQNLRTKQLLELIDMVEKHVEEEKGLVDIDTAYELDSDLGDRLGTAHDALRNRLEVPCNYWKDEADTTIGNNEDRSKQNAKKIESLQNHVHDQQGNVAYRNTKLED
jgi:hypothetical protein